MRMIAGRKSTTVTSAMPSSRGGMGTWTPRPGNLCQPSLPPSSPAIIATAPPGAAAEEGYEDEGGRRGGAVNETARAGR
eukprot:353438-Chlamydomonas_euryale.AAC.6